MITDTGARIDDERLMPPFDTKIAIVVRDDLESWQRLNVTAFLASGIAAANPDLIGAPYRDGDGESYLPLLGIPMLVFEGGADTLAAARERAARRGIAAALYVHPMFATGHDAANRSTITDVASADLDVVGLAVHGPKSQVDKIIKGAHLHP